MKRACVLLLLVAYVACATLKDLGQPGWSCDSSVMQKSKTVPNSVHSLRFADIDVIGALGDSLTAANGAGAHPKDPVAILIQYRGLTFSVGGDKSLDEHITVANILKKFNPSLFGWSKGTGSANVWENARLNAGIPGAHAIDLIEQAHDIVRRLQAHPEVDYKKAWKLIHIFIGGNDMCHYCDSPDTESAEKYRDNIRDSIKILKENLPRTIVVLTGMLDMSLLRKIDKDQLFCDGLHLFECKCESKTDFTDEMLSAASHLYMDREQELEDSGMFDTTDDFTLVIQPFFEGITIPPLQPNGNPDLSFFAPDCFHFSQYGHAVVAKNLWNNMVEPVGAKTHIGNLTNDNGPLKCPDKSCPFIRTTKNSKDCSKYMTPSA